MARNLLRLEERKIRPALLGLMLVVMVLFPVHSLAGNSAVIFMYHRFGEGDFPSTSIRMDQFEAHLNELKTGGYTVMALGDIVRAFKNGEALPEKTVALTIDDAFLSVYEKAWPKFRELGYPFTVFVSTGTVDKGIRGYM